MSTLMASTPVRWLRRGWRLLDLTRRGILNVLLLALLLALAWWLIKPAHPALHDKTALVLDLRGRLVEQGTSVNVREQALGMASNADTDYTRLRDVLAVLEAAAADPKITHALLLPEGLSGASLPTLREVSAALGRFKAAGKPVYAWAGDYNQAQYFLAAHASEVWLHPMGNVYVEGYGRQRTYYKDLFDKLGLSATVVRAGKYKSAAESFVANGPSPETLEAEGAVWSTLWTSYTTAVEAARKQPAGSVVAAIDSLPASLQAAQGNTARWALDRKWVDALKTRDELRQWMIDKGAKDDEHHSFQQVHWADYLSRVKPRSSKEAVGVVVAQGSIVDGRTGLGSIGGESTADLIRKARHNEQIKALVLRVDSPGGSAYASELVRRELELTRKAGKPVVVSMAGLAASGGYWISMAADEVIADEATITGSIGVVGVLPSAKGALDKLGVHTGGASTTWLAGQRDPRRALDPRFVELMQIAVDGIYRDFTTLVAGARKSSPEKIHELAQGRVWSGKDALARGLVDRLGNQADAVASARRLAKLPADTRLEYLEVEPGRLQRLLQGFGMAQGGDGWGAASAGGHNGGHNGSFGGGPLATTAQASLLATGLPWPVLQGLAQDLADLQDLAGLLPPAGQQRPYALAAHCLCAPP